MTTSSFNIVFILLCLIPEIGFTQEICDNAIDDDGNGLIDLNDASCDCEVIDYRSMIPNPSFEAYSCCPSKPAQMECVNDWSQASAGTIDYMNLCNWTGEDHFSPPFPIPDGDACVRLINGNRDIDSRLIDHKEYAGVCLNYPMVKDSLYIFELYVGFAEASRSPDFNISFFGTDDCTNLPFSTGMDYSCPLRYTGFTLLQSKVIPNDGGDLWKKINIEIKPEQDVSAIVIGPDCIRTEGREDYFYYLDDFILNKESDLDFKLLETGSPCSPEFAFAVADNAGFSYQWYKEGIALVGEANAELSSMHGEGRYQLRIMSGAACRVSEDYIFSIPVYTDNASQVICEGDEYLFGDQWLTQAGVYMDTLVSVGNCDSIITLNLEVKENSIDSLHKDILVGAAFELDNVSYDTEGIYPISLLTTEGCDSLVILELSVSDIYIPNIFSPNGDGQNDVFRIYKADTEIVNVNISIYDRWGMQVFVGEEWNGMSGGEKLNAGVFVYNVEITTLRGEKLMYQGDVTLLR